MSRQTKTETLRLKVTPELKARLEAVAERAEVSVAQVVRQAIRLYLEQEKER